MCVVGRSKSSSVTVAGSEARSVVTTPLMRLAL
jgi:hypothetical protein